LRVTPCAVTQWLKGFVDEGLERVARIPHYCSPQRSSLTQEDAFRQAVEQLRHGRGGCCMRGENIRQLLGEQCGVAYTLNGVYKLLNRLDMEWMLARSVRSNVNPARQMELKKLRL
jgi:transposase